MAIQWKPIINRLTTPTSYSAQVIIDEVVYIDELASRINLNNPNYPTNIIKDIIESSYAEIANYLAEGRPVTLEGLISFKMSVVKRLDTVNDSISNDDLQVRINPSRPFEQGIRQKATTHRVDPVINVPNIVSTRDTNTGYSNYLNANSILDIQGSNLKFDTTDNTQGLFIKNTANDATTHATHYGKNTSSTILVIPTIPVSTTDWQVEYLLAVKARYTPTGTLRVGESPIPLRSLISITTATDYPQGILTGGPVQSTPFANITAFAYENGGASLTDWTVRIQCIIDGQALRLNIIDSQNFESPSIKVTTETTIELHRVTQSGTAVGVVTIDIADFSKLYKLTKLSYAGILVEVVHLGAVS